MITLSNFISIKDSAISISKFFKINNAYLNYNNNTLTISGDFILKSNNLYFYQQNISKSFNINDYLIINTISEQEYNEYLNNYFLNLN